jgi:acetate kinase
MGFSPVDGLVMGTRSGDVDPSALLFIAEKEGMTLADINTMINKRSGVEGLSGISSDMRDIDDAYEAGNPRAIVARDLYYDRVRQYIGKYAALMGGVDMVIFTGGVGENSWDLRARATKGLEFMGVEINDAVNRPTRGTDTIISTENSRVKVAVIATNEELVIATDTYNLVK